MTADDDIFPNEFPNEVRLMKFMPEEELGWHN